MAKISRVRADVADDEQDSTEDERPAKSSGFASGWGTRQRSSEERTERVQAPYLKLKDNGKRIVKILSAEPNVRFQRHYIKSRHAYVTCALAPADCPLSQAGHKFSWAYLLNVIDMDDDPTEVKTWTFGPEVAGQLQDIAEDKELPINDIGAYFEVYHYKQPGKTAPSTKVQFIRGKYIEDEYGLLPLNESEIEELEGKQYGKETLFISTESFLENAAEELLPTDLAKRS